MPHTVTGEPGRPGRDARPCGARRARIGSATCDSDSSSRRAGDSTWSTSTRPTTGRSCTGLATHADAGDAWESIWVYDHFHTVPEPTDEATHEAWTLMAAYAASTSRIRLGQMCTCMSYRNPAYLAKVAATVDVISGGRVRDGHRWWLVRARVARLRLRLPRCRGAARPGSTRACRSCATCGVTAASAWTASTIRWTTRSCRPKPLQENGIPLWIAGGGEKEDAAHRRQVRAVHQLRRHSGDLGAQVVGARGALQGRRPRLRRDHPVGATSTS